MAVPSVGATPPSSAQLRALVRRLSKSLLEMVRPVPASVSSSSKSRLGNSLSGGGGITCCTGALETVGEGSGSPCRAGTGEPLVPNMVSGTPASPSAGPVLAATYWTASTEPLMVTPLSTRIQLLEKIEAAVAKGELTIPQNSQKHQRVDQAHLNNLISGTLTGLCNISLLKA